MITLATITNVREAVQFVARHPLIGRLVDTYRRELNISRAYRLRRIVSLVRCH